VIDQDLAAEGWDPADPEYWDELDNRLTAPFATSVSEQKRQAVYDQCYADRI